MQQKSNLVLVITSHNKKQLLRALSATSHQQASSPYPSTPDGKNQQKLSNPLNPVL
jgi:hypothetical protein